MQESARSTDERTEAVTISNTEQDTLLFASQNLEEDTTDEEILMHALSPPGLIFEVQQPEELLRQEIEGTFTWGDLKK